MIDCAAAIRALAVAISIFFPDCALTSFMNCCNWFTPDPKLLRLNDDAAALRSLSNVFLTPG